MKYLKRTVSLLLVTMLLGISVLGDVTVALAAEATGDVVPQAEEAKEEVTTGNQAVGDKDEDKDEDLSGNQITEEKDESSTGGQMAEETGESAESQENVSGEIQSNGLINYVYVELPYIESPDVQKVAVSFGDGTEAVSDARIYLENENGGSVEMSLTKQEDTLYLFERQFTDSEVGVYHITEFTYVQDGRENTINLKEIGVEALFGVDEYYPGYLAGEDEVIDAEDIEVSVVDVDAGDPEEVEEEIEEALKENGVAKSGGAEKARTYSAALPTDSSDIVVVLDPGHGGNDAGASGNGVDENTINYKIATYCKQELEEYFGVTVYLTRSKTGNPSIYERVQIAKNYGADVLVSLHNNSAVSSQAHGAEVWYPHSNYNPTVGEQGKNLAQKIQGELVALGLADRGIHVKYTQDDTYPDGSKQDWYGIIRYSKEAGFPGIIVEHAFVSNADDVQNYLSSDEKLQKLGIADATGIANYFNLQKGGWKSDSKGYWFEFKDGSRLKSCWKKITGAWYYFDSEGYRKTGWLNDAGKKYYFETDGKMVVGWKEIDHTYYYFENSGAMHKGWLQSNGKWYYLGQDGKMAVGVFTADNHLYYAQSSGAVVMSTGWQQLDGAWYYFENEGIMRTGWLWSNGRWYYLNTDGKMAVGFVDVKGKTYYMNESGAMLTGWQKIGNTWYYFDGTGAMCRGWLKSNGKWYYLNQDGKMATGWITDQNKTYYLWPSGEMAVGTVTIEGKVYKFASNGSLISGEGGSSGDTSKRGWQFIDGKWYYYGNNGVKQTGWLKDGTYWYHFNTSGVMSTGWVEDSSGKYYLNPVKDSDGPQGAMAVGWKSLNGTYYYFNKGRSPEGALYYTGVNPIMGVSDLGTDKTAVVKKMVAMYERSGRTYPAAELAKGQAADITTFCSIIYEEAVAENVKPEVVFGQAMNETGYLKFGGDVLISQFNFAGLGATGNGVRGEKFPDVRTGIRAQVQHLKAYASTEPLNNKCVDNRFIYVKRGCAPYVEWLGIQENPAPKTGWAASRNYGFSLMNLYIKPMYSMK